MRKNQINVGLYEEARKVHDIRRSAQSLCRNERNCRLSAGVSNATPGFKGCSRMGRVVFEILLRSSIQPRPATPEAGCPAQSAYTKSHSLFGKWLRWRSRTSGPTPLPMRCDHH